MKSSRIAILTFGIFMLFGCAVTPKKSITELYEPLYQSDYNYTPKQTQSAPVGYNVGIINMKFESESKGVKITDSRLAQEYTSDFKKGVSSSLEKILMSKGITVSGPFESYEEMTYPQRSRCDFLVQPTVKIVLSCGANNVQILSDYAGPQGQSFTYKKINVPIDAKAEMEYVILDPLTQEKLERHKLVSDPIQKSALYLGVKYERKDKQGNIIEEYYKSLEEDTDHPGYYNNVYIAYGKIINELYGNYMSKLDGLISVDEFNHLQKYKEELKEKKRY